MAERVPSLIDPLRMSEKNGFFKSELVLSGFPRLQEYLVDDNGVAEFELTFGKHGKIASVTGYVKAKLKLRCQVCLEVMKWVVDSQIKLGIAASLDEAKLLPDAYEPLVLTDDRVAIGDIVEDELLLSLPAIPKHGDCQIQNMASLKPTKAKESPFSILNQLKD